MATLTYEKFKEAIPYEQFKNDLISATTNILAVVAPDKKLEILNDIKKNEKLLTGIRLVKNEEKTNSFPLAYIESLYEEMFEACRYKVEESGKLSEENCTQDYKMDLYALCMFTIRELEEESNSVAFMPDEIGKKIVDKQFILDNVVLNTINAEANAEDILKERPAIIAGDMAICYNVIVEMNDTGILSAPCNNDLLKMAKLNRDELHKAAMNNTPKMFPYTSVKIEEGLYEIKTEKCLSQQATLFYPGILSMMAKRMGSDLWVAPTGQGLIVMRAEKTEMDEFMHMFAIKNLQSNQDNVTSSCVFCYSRNENRLEPVAKYAIAFPDGLKKQLETLMEAMFKSMNKDGDLDEEN